VLPDDKLAFSTLGRDDNFQRSTWLRFAEYCQLPEKTALRVLNKQASILEDATQLIERCFLPDDQKEQYNRLITERTAKIS